MKKGIRKLLKEDMVCEYCFSDPSVEEILWEVY